MVPSSAVTVYVTGFVKSCMAPDAGETVAFAEVVMVVTSFVTSVPAVTVAEMVLAAASTVAFTAGLRALKANADIAFSELFGGVTGVSSVFLQETTQSNSGQHRVDRRENGVFMARFDFEK